MRAHWLCLECGKRFYPWPLNPHPAHKFTREARAHSNACPSRESLPRIVWHDEDRRAYGNGQLRWLRRAMTYVPSPSLSLLAAKIVAASLGSSPSTPLSINSPPGLVT